jgi:hypothetical protein
MNVGGVYEVIGNLAYSGYEPGQVFMTTLEPRAEDRAIRRGNIKLLERIIPSLPPGYKLPRGWAEPSKEV